MTDLFPGLEPELSDENLRIMSLVDSSTVDYFKLIGNLDDSEPVTELKNEDYTWSCVNCETDDAIKMLNDTIICTKCGEVFEHILDQ